ncbi:bifunctional 4-hydroxy-2-oxoglutarate aldolase/2-dehydro-3-deoxy-phosphogluconate aldolase [Endozoicomonas elysicola]|uniref:2-dehydro-3-deoxyphosphogluconate aldolase n=1 Tax=Endozoicomonas elysicola TaxID=305900 RepID=A0A081K592_9GAMM|nr:bifunctional 4-hydroxy-2-oxoglutarate aldolase/2-dehydro-3-deoxy-phosphogluconate aldolase [Endozoicomonas elysicola]KEI69318.1 2-dehydro-3-deoxyphosphogluconate aldolase [Endozoicomonas elysicola]
MDMILKQLQQQRVLPVIQIEDLNSAEPLAEILIAHGFPIMEITLRSDVSLAAIKRISKRYPQSILSAGTVLTPEQVDAARQAGAEFVISPGFNPVTYNHALQSKVFMVPGINSPSDIEQAMYHGAQVLKFFPAEASGSVNMLKSLTGPYQHIRVIPTGGISPDNLASYLQIPQVIACGGTWLATVDSLNQRKWNIIEEKVKAARQLIDCL